MALESVWLDTSCLLGGAVRLLAMPVLLYLWHRKTGARLLPALAALGICFPAFLLAGGIRAGFSRENAAVYYIMQGILYGVFEEGAKFLAMRFLLTSCNNRHNAVSYGLGHSGFEEIGAGFTCLGLIGTGNASPHILFFQILSTIDGTVFCVGLSVLIFYGISRGKSLLCLPCAMLLHAAGNMSVGLLAEPVSIIVTLLVTAVIGCTAVWCWRKMEDHYGI